MALSNELISQYAKVSAGNNKKQARTDSTVYGTTKIVDGKQYVKLDGSDLLTPVQSTSSVSNDDRVSVSIKNHTATITGNLSDPSASSITVTEQGEKITEQGEKISEFDIIVADKITVDELNAVNGRIDNLVSENVTITGRLDANEATIKDLNADNVVIKENLTAQDAEIENLKTTTLKAKDAELTYATISDLEATNAYIYALEGTYGDFKVLTTERLDAVEATIKDLTVEDLSAKYANIDFANIGEAAIENFYAKSGMIKDMTIEDGVVTGELTSVRINADYITSGTLQTDRLLVKGEDGLYYKLNIEGGATVTEKISEEDLQNGIHGTVIIAESITADKISVSDLYAFEATIGGFIITDSSLYSGVKESVENTTRGVYLDKEGQIAFGDAHNFVKFYKVDEDNTALEISANSIKLQSEGSSSDVATSEAVDGIEENLQETDKKVDDTDSKIGELQAQIELLDGMISTLVTDENGNSLMTQTGDKWTFNISGIEKNLNDSNKQLSELMTLVGKLSNTTEGLTGAVENLEKTSEYVWVTTYEDEPCLALGESDSTNGLFITNTRIIFIKEGGNPTYIDKDGLYTERLEVGVDFRHKDFVWAVRANGNFGLSWKPVVLTGIQVVYVGEDVVVGTDLRRISGIVVRGVYSNGRIRKVTGYTLSGEIVEGANEITVTYEGFTATFFVKGIPLAIEEISVTYRGGLVNVGTEISELTDIVVLASYNNDTEAELTDYTLSGANTSMIEGDNTVTLTYEETDNEVTWIKNFLVPAITTEIAIGNFTSSNFVVWSTSNTSEYGSVTYADSITVTDGALALVDSKSIKFYRSTSESYETNDYNAIIGKYVKYGSSYYYVEKECTTNMPKHYSHTIVNDTYTAERITWYNVRELTIAESSGSGGDNTTTGDGTVLGEATTCVAYAWMSSSTSAATVTYADSVEVVDGVVTLVDTQTASFYMTTSANYSSNDYSVLCGKYIKGHYVDNIYYIDPESTYVHNTDVSDYVKENIVYQTAYLVSVAE